MNNILPIVIISLALLFLIILIIIRNRKDEKEFESQLKNDYHKPKAHDAGGEDERI